MLLELISSSEADVHCAADEPEGEEHQPQHQPAQQQQRKEGGGQLVHVEVVADLGHLKGDVAGIMQQHHQGSHPREPVHSP